MVEMKKYQEEMHTVMNMSLPWNELENKTILISGATGMIGTFLIEILMEKRIGTKIIALGRNRERAKERFADYWNTIDFTFIEQDINQPIKPIKKVDFVIHAASNTHPIAYASDPIGTIITNIIGTENMLEYARMSGAKRFLFLSSVEVYGENRGDVERFKEEYCGYIDCNTLRAGYPEGKRAGEALCQAYRKKYGMDIRIGRLARTYGPTMLNSDTKAISQFIKKGIGGENIVLKSKGNQLYSYIFVADAVSALFTILLMGKDGEAYNISDINSEISLKNLAKLIADLTKKKVIFELPPKEEMEGYSKATKAILDSSKLIDLGWRSYWNIENGIERTLKCINQK